MALRRLISLVVPDSVAVVAFLHAQATGALVDTTAAPASIAPCAEARAAAANADSVEPAKLAALILERKPIDPRAERAWLLPDGVHARQGRSWR